NDRLRPTGVGSRVARFVVHKASVVETKLPVDESLGAFFKKQQGMRYDGELDVKLEILDEHGLEVESVTATAEKGQTVAQDITEDAREKIWFDLVQALGQEMNKRLEENKHSLG